MRRVALLTLLSCLSFPAMMVVNSYRFGYGPNDAFWRTLMTPFEGTVWVAGFSETSFLKIRTGMTATEVLSLLGDPLRKSCDQEGCLWIYTWQNAGNADFDQRWIDFDPLGQVKEIRKSFFID